MNKFTKLLSVFVIAGAIGTGIAGVAGCVEKKPADKHDYQYTQIKGDAEKHNVSCKNHEGEEKTESHSWSGNECSKCHYVKSEPGDSTINASNATGIMVEYTGDLEVTLSESATTATIDLSKVKVYYKKDSTKGTEVAAADCTITVGKEGTPIEELTGLKQGHYEILVEVGNWEDSVEIDILNPIKTNSLAVKAGATLTQPVGAQDQMSANWTYEVTRANGDKEDYTETVTVTVDTMTAGTKTATLTSGNLTGTVEVIITENENAHFETYAVNLSGKEVGVLAGEAPADSAVELFKSANGNTKLEARGLKVEANGNSAAKECDGKYFVNRAPLAGATFTSTDTLQTNQRYFILTTEGAAKLTIYWSRNSSADERGVSVFNSTVTDGDISALTPGATTIAKDTLTTGDQSVQKMEVNIPAAGTYWITSANKNNLYFYYIELTTQFETAGDNVALEDGANVLANVKVSHDKVDDKAYVQQFTVGDMFTVDAGYSVTGTFVTANTAKKSEQTLTEGLTYWLGNTQLTPGETELSAELFEQLGENTVTVKYGEQTVTGEYTIFVDSAVPGVTGITASVKDTVNPVLASETAKLTLAKTDIELAIVGENANAQITASTVKYKAKDADDSTAIEITESVELGAGDYVILVTATVEDATANKSASFEATVALKVVVEGNGASWLYQDQDANKTIGSGNTGLNVNDVIDNNGSFTAVALNKAVAGYNKDSTNFETKITDATNKPVAAAANTASGEAVTFTNALAFDTKAGDGTDYIKITAKKATTIYVYMNASDDKHGSDRKGTAITYTVNGGTATDVTVSSDGRKAVTVVQVTLAAGDELVIGAKKGASCSDPRIWFYGIEAVDVAAE